MERAREAEWEAQEACVSLSGSSGACLHSVAGTSASSGRPLPFSLPICCSVPLSLGLLLSRPPSPPLASQGLGLGLFFWLNKDFLVDTLTWPVVFGEGLQRQLLISPLSSLNHVTYSQALDPKQSLLHVYCGHWLQLGPHLGLGTHHSLPFLLLSYVSLICALHHQRSLLAETHPVSSWDARGVTALTASPSGFGQA